MKGLREVGRRGRVRVVAELRGTHIITIARTFAPGVVVKAIAGAVVHPNE